MKVLPDRTNVRALRGLAAGLLVVVLGAVFELVGRTLFPPARALGVLLAFVGFGVFLVAGIWYLVSYLQQFLP